MIKSVRFLWALVALFIISCASGLQVSHPPDPYARTLHYPVYIDDSFSPEDKQQIKDALAVWNKTLNNYQQYDLKDEHWKPNMVDELGEEVILNQREGMRFVKMSEDSQSDGVLGWVDDLGDDVVHLIPNRCRAFGGEDGVKIVAMHEMGHSLGIPHVGVKGALLYPYYTNQAVVENGNCIDNITATMLSLNNRRFSLEHLNYCNLP